MCEICNFIEGFLIGIFEGIILVSLTLAAVDVLYVLKETFFGKSEEKKEEKEEQETENGKYTRF